MKKIYWLLLSALVIAAGCNKQTKEIDEEGGGEETPEVTKKVEVATPDTWAAIDELGREMPLKISASSAYKNIGEDEAPNKSMRSGKTVAMFYWTWHCESQMNYPWVVNISQVIKNHPECMQNPADVNDPVWGQKLQPCFWAEPLFGYYRATDEWVLRKHAEMLADAGVDAVFFDCTNGHFTWMDATRALMKVWNQAQKDGVNVPKIAFLLPFGPTEDSLISLRQLYNDIYKNHTYKNLWYMIKGKPVIMAYPDNLTSSETDQAIKKLFEFRPGQPDYINGPSRDDQWGWLECFPQHEYHNHEQMPVGVAQNATKENGKHCYAFNAPGAFGRSYTDKNGFDDSEMAYLQGYNFQEQWERALTVNPTVVWITGWNEWIAGRQPNWPPNNPYKPFAFPDEYDYEHSRDLEPVAEWGDYGDVYYYQLVRNVRRFKGISKYPYVSDKKTVKVGAFEGWSEVSPDFKHYKGNTLHRNHLQHSKSGVIYTNNTGRNDIVDCRVARDDEYVYFYVETAATLTPRSEKAWMRLLVNTDRDIKTGWKGYDFILNYKNPTSDTAGIISKCTGTTWEWKDSGTFEYAVKGNMMEIKVARKDLGMTGALDFEFKWSDNMQEEGNILDFYVNGDCAPGGRFNFVYTAD